MQLKWLRIRFRGGRGMHRVSAAPLSGESRDCPALLLGAGQQRSVPAQKVGREVSPHSCGARIAVPSGGPGATEESREFSRARHRPLPGGAGPPPSVWVPRWGLRAVSADGPPVRTGGRPRLVPRLLVLEWLHPTRLETRTKECNMRASLGVTNPVGAMKVKAGVGLLRREPPGGGASSTDPRLRCGGI